MKYLNLNMKPSLFLAKALLVIVVSTSLISCDAKSKDDDSNVTANVEVVVENKSPNNLVQELGVDEQAVTILKNSLDYLSKLNTFSVNVQSSLEDVMESGHRIDLQFVSTLTVNRPNKLHAERHGSFWNQILYFNGNEITLYNTSKKYFATETINGSIDDMFHFARDEFELQAPASDLIYSNSFSLLMYEVNGAVVIGTEVINNVECDHLLFSRPGVDFQIWVAKNGAPLPYKYVVTDTSTPELLAISLVFEDWNEKPKASEKLFKFNAPKDASQIAFIKGTK